MNFDDNVEDEIFDEREMNEGNNEIKVDNVRLRRNRVAPDRFGGITGNWWDFADVANVAITDVEEPKNLTEALS